MSDEFALSEGSIIINEGNIIWSDAENNSIQYVINDDSLVDSTLNEGYITAIDDSTSQYFSVLETSNDNDVTLEDLHNLTLENPKSAFLDNLIITEDNTESELEISLETEANNANQNDVVVFKMDDELYGIQAAEDEHGNLQKYKFKFRTTNGGQLEAIPETVELVTSTEEISIGQEVATENGGIECGTLIEERQAESQIENQQFYTEEDDHIYIKGEVHSETEELDPDEETEVATEEVENKGNILKEEILNELKTIYHFPKAKENEKFLEVIAYNPLTEESEPDDQILESQNVEEEHPDVYHADGSQCEPADEDTYVQEVDDHGNLDENTFVSCFQRNDEEINDMDETSQEITEQRENHHQQVTNREDTDDEFFEEIYVDENLEDPPTSPGGFRGRENNTVPVSQTKSSDKLTNPNPRSILKSSFDNTTLKGLKQVIRTKTAISTVFPSADERYQNKRFARNKDVQEAKKFHHFLNRTTIPQAPVRKSRLPRKQQITAGNREDEEIIVQEVLVCSNGVVTGPLHDRLQRDSTTEVTAVVELSDSEDDTNQSNKRKRRGGCTSESRSESEASIISIYSIDENIENKPLEVKKRLRGRPRKSEVKGRPPSLILEVTKKEIRCPYCPKTFPSQNSLNTHIHHHNLENSLRKAQNMLSKSSTMPRQSLLPSLEYNHKCQECEQTFKNSILLQRHVCLKKSTTYNCSYCSRKFVDMSLFNIHKKSHIKSTLVRNTSSEKISPKKIKTVASGMFKSPRKSVFRSPRKSTVPKKQEYRCEDCSKLCFSETNLKIHQKTHKKFSCTSCSATYTSRILLDTHVRLSCVKVRSPSNKRLSLKIRKSFMNSPAKRMSIARTKPNNRPVFAQSKTTDKLNTTTQSNSSDNPSKGDTSALFILECDICKMPFSTHRNLFTHKVQKHGLSTPDKSVTAKPKKSILYKAKAAHGGIPTNDRMKKAYEALRKKLAETTVDMEMSSVYSNLE